jgi:hypothetical protein
MWENQMTRYRTLILTAVLLMLVAGAGCKSNEQASAPEAEKAPVTIESSAVPSQQPDQTPAVQAGKALEGKITETMDAAGYTYVNVETADGQQWFAMPETKVEVGQDITLAGGMEMQNFESKTLGKTFDSVIFSTGINPHVGDAGAPVAPTGDQPAPAGGDSFAEAMQAEAGMSASAPPMGEQVSSGGSSAAMVPSAEVQVEKVEGENGYTIGEIFEKKGELDNQKVRVRGKVMKVSLMIMGKNWIHLQDGTGDPGSNDLVVTTMAEPEKDSIVVIEGTLHADRDFGAGYRYAVIVEDAEIK